MSNYAMSRVLTRVAKKIWNELPEEGRKIFLSQDLNKESFIYAYVQEGIKQMKKESFFSDDELKEIDSMSDNQLDEVINSNLFRNGKLMTITNTETNESKTYELKK